MAAVESPLSTLLLLLLLLPPLLSRRLWLLLGLCYCCSN
jgi:hypothetical protein